MMLITGQRKYGNTSGTQKAGMFYTLKTAQTFMEHMLVRLCILDQEQISTLPTILFMDKFMFLEVMDFQKL